MGQVFEVTLPGDPRPHVAKLLTAIGGVAVERFRREGEVVARLDAHPGIVRVGSIGLLDGKTPYLIFEQVIGAPLTERIENGPLDVEETLRIGSELAAALAHAHARGVVHRDVKPDNILLDESGAVRLLDFGLALAADMTRLTQTDFTVGTPAYLACEQVGGSNQPQGPWTDVHAVGLILYECLVGSSPFSGRDAMTLMAQVVAAVPKPVSNQRDDVSPGLDAVVARCLAKDPAERYTDCGELLAELERVARNEPPEALGLARRRRAVLWTRRAVATLALVVGVVLGLLLFDRALEKSPTPDVQPIRRSARTAPPLGADRGPPPIEEDLDLRYRACLPSDFVGLREAARGGLVRDPALARDVAKAWIDKADRDLKVHGITDAWFKATKNGEGSPAWTHVEAYVHTAAEAVRAAPQVDLLTLGKSAWIPRLALARGFGIEGRGGSSAKRTLALTLALLAPGSNDPSLLAAAALCTEDKDSEAALELSKRALTALDGLEGLIDGQTHLARDFLVSRRSRLLGQRGRSDEGDSSLAKEARREHAGPRVILAHARNVERTGSPEELERLCELLALRLANPSAWALAQGKRPLGIELKEFLERVRGVR